MVMDDKESSSCNSRAAETQTPVAVGGPANQRQQRQKLEVYNEVLRRLKDSNNPESLLPGFDDELWSHFNRLPARFLPSLCSSIGNCIVLCCIVLVYSL